MATRCVEVCCDDVCGPFVLKFVVILLVSLFVLKFVVMLLVALFVLKFIVILFVLKLVLFSSSKKYLSQINMPRCVNWLCRYTNIPWYVKQHSLQPIISLAYVSKWQIRGLYSHSFI